MAYFDFLSNIEYKFTDGLTKNVKSLFSRPILDTAEVNKIEISENQSPDQLSISLYGDPSLYYINGRSPVKNLNKNFSLIMLGILFIF